MKVADEEEVREGGSCLMEGCMWRKRGRKGENKADETEGNRSMPKEMRACLLLMTKL